MREQTLQAKSQNVEEIKEKISRAQSVVVVDYRGLNVEQLTELRSRYRKAGVEYKVYKNTMMRFAFKDSGLEEFNEFLKGPNAVAFGYDDPVQVAKITSDFAKENDKLEIKAGIVDGKIIDVNGVKDLANLPPREVLVAQALGGLNAPIQGFANVLQGTIRGLAVVLNAIAEKQGA
ncbi:50S ribosomal protein L10 [Tissierella praeacuta]|uniref:Large ribosomal subunit protein uL10 n=1 Tax=Tissierella praeacuta DSM 18095 TaxID=1123404 RepID=A0A1M4ZSG7_9FIRM|nr:50S ribosomal protein L10 [Tissierella praeacuta]HAE91271.1 50S ribosomal protein L10 [Tissierella sp.]MBU5256359.1 50S ribosomal protein L10 [Tissierella praeacuta]TCU69720.1 LSU ribosomal protein L10P [Tissierella praeacuta]SHF20954.1 LSU ribosomal protein L10P [Tissierella praeacuta DSM 18095]SUP03322.1 Vegetative protein 300 [Tissierella praeacuta]